MAQYLSFKLKKNKIAKLLKFLPDEIEMDYLCTTAARTIGQYAYVYTEDDRLVSKSDNDGMKKLVDEYKKHSDYSSKEYNSITDMLLKAETVSAATVLKDKLEDYKGFVEYDKELYNDALRWHRFIRRIRIKSFFFKPFYNLYYTNC